jgi:hypothetical protein
MVGRHVEGRDLGRVAEAAVRHQPGSAAHHQPRREDGAGRGCARVPAAVHDQHRAGRALLDRLALRMLPVAEHGERVEILARRDVAQREGLADHGFGPGPERMDVLDELVAQAPLEQGGGERGGADRLEFGPGLGGELGHGRGSGVQ